MSSISQRFPQRRHLSRIPVWLPLDQPVVYFVTACCANRRAVFVAADAVRIGAECLQRIEARQNWTVSNVCFMPDHVHLLISPAQDRNQSLSDFMRAWKSCVALRLGQGTIWQREFHDHLLRSDEKAEEKWQYIRENPVRAGLCDEPEDYPFSGSQAEILSRFRRTTP